MPPVMSDTNETTPPTPKAPITAADPIAAIVCTVVFVLSAVGVPGWLGLSAAAVTAIGSGVVTCAASGRAIYRAIKGAKVDLQDPIAAALGAVVLVLSLLGVPNASTMDGNTIAMVASSLAGLFTILRARKQTTKVTELQ